MLVAAAGPASNLLQAIVVAVLFHALPLEDINFLNLNWPNVFRRAADINILLALFNLIPVPPLDGGNVLAGLLPREAAAAFDSVRQFGFIILYALMLTGVLSQIDSAAGGLPDGATRSVKPRVLSGMRPTGKLHLGHLVGALDNWASLQDQLRLFLLRRRLARADERLRRHLRDRRQRLRHGGRLGCGRPRPRAQHAVRPVARARARRALSAAVDDDPDSLAGAGADLQGADRAAGGEGSVDARVSWAIRCCKRPTSSSTMPATFRSAKIRSPTWSSAARSSAAFTTSTASCSSSPRRC